MLKKILRIGFTGVILASVLVCVLPIDMGIFRSSSNYTVHIMFANLALGILFLILDEKQLLFISFLACALLCIYLKTFSNNVLKLPTKTVQASLNIAQLNITSTHEHIYETIESIKNTDVDILSLQEITPDLGILLKQELAELYPYRSIVYRKEDFLGIGIFSKLPFANIDTFYVDDIPNLSMDVLCADKETSIITSFVYPELSSADNTKVLAQFEAIQKYAKQKSKPIIAVGDYNQLQFSNYLKELKREAFLNDSRRFQFFDNPTDHILFSSHFECVEFQTISNRFTNHLGIKGSYQLNNSAANVQEPNTQF